MDPNTTFNSERDTNISNTHQRDLATKESLITMWKQRSEGMEKALFGERNLTARLTKLLGFESVGEAVLFIETANAGCASLSYRDCLERNGNGEVEVVRERYENECGVVKRELEECTARLEAVEAEKRALESKYDDLERTFKKAQAKHVHDNAKFIRWKHWFWGEWEIDKTLDENELAKKWAMGFKRRRKVVAMRGQEVFDDMPLKSDFEVDESPVKGSDATTPTLVKPSTSTALPLTPTTKNNCALPPSSPGPSSLNPRRDDSLSSDTEAQSTPIAKPPNPHASPSRYLKRTQGFTASTSRHDASPRSSPIPVPVRIKEEEEDDSSGPARKRRRVSPGASKRKPKPLVWSPSQIRMPPPVSTTPVEVPRIRKKLGDYSAYKGRGRYARKNDKERALNEMFEVDADVNQGRDYQFEEVVRGRENRRKMAAGDCEECREYYKAIGPRPDRLKQPLWRSPVRENKNPSTSSSCNHRRAGTPPSPSPSHIDSHRQEISRHRYNWERAKTPPGYWNIGFPDTQEVEDYNERAKDMHREKYKAVEREAERGGGRYKRR
ncbi:hypothetical protein PM082_008237 [Marasmius tenuissimus]|nr:hypothetical protein PM082_008237 [Marasmius tenuissimus]